MGGTVRDDEEEEGPAGPSAMPCGLMTRVEQANQAKVPPDQLTIYLRDWRVSGTKASRDRLLACLEYTIYDFGVKAGRDGSSQVYREDLLTPLFFALHTCIDRLQRNARTADQIPRYLREEYIRVARDERNFNRGTISAPSASVFGAKQRGHKLRSLYKTSGTNLTEHSDFDPHDDRAPDALEDGAGRKGQGVQVPASTQAGQPYRIPSRLLENDTQAHDLPMACDLCSTQTEVDVLQCWLGEFTVAETAQELGITEYTVEKARNAIRARAVKLGLEPPKKKAAG